MYEAVVEFVHPQVRQGRASRPSFWSEPPKFFYRTCSSNPSRGEVFLLFELQARARLEEDLF